MIKIFSKKKGFIFSLLLVLTLVFTGCSSNANKSAEYMTAASGDYYYGEEVAASTAQSTSAVSAGAMSTGAVADSAGYSQDFATMGNSIPENVKLIYTGSIAMETIEFDNSVNSIFSFVKELGGYFENSSVSGKSYRTAEYIIRIPAESFDTFCNGVGNLGTVRRISRSAQDISETYYDTEARLETQKIKLQRLQELLKAANDVEEIIYLESSISETEYIIEQLSGTLKHYDSLVGYSTVTLSLTEVFRLTEDEAPATDFSSKFGEALSKGTDSFIEGCQDFAIDFAYNWGAWLIFAIIVIINIIIIKVIIKKSKRKIAIARAQNAARQQNMIKQSLQEMNYTQNEDSFVSMEEFESDSFDNAGESLRTPGSPKKQNMKKHRAAADRMKNNTEAEQQNTLEADRDVQTYSAASGPETAMQPEDGSVKKGFPARNLVPAAQSLQEQSEMELIMGEGPTEDESYPMDFTHLNNLEDNSEDV